MIVVRVPLTAYDPIHPQLASHLRHWRSAMPIIIRGSAAKPRAAKDLRRFRCQRVGKAVGKILLCWIAPAEVRQFHESAEAYGDLHHNGSFNDLALTALWVQSWEH